MQDRRGTLGLILTALAALALAALASVGCQRDEDPPLPSQERPRSHLIDGGLPSPEPPARLREEMEALRVEAGFAPDEPAGTPGDLQHEIASFSTLDRCVAEHAPKDALLADAIDALGYPAITRDACRTLDALRARDKARCTAIDATPLRRQCEASVAVLVGNPDLCPGDEHGLGPSSRGGARDPVCLARASGNERLCAAAPPGDRIACVAFVRGNPIACGDDAACAREVARYRSLARPKAAPSRDVSHVHIDVRGADGTTDTGSFDLTDAAQAGAVVSKGPTGVHVSLGQPKNAFWPSWDAPDAMPRLALALTLSPHELIDASTTPGVDRVSFDVVLPKIASLSSSTAVKPTVTVFAVDTQRGGPVKLRLETKVLAAPREYEITIDVATFVRDVTAGSASE